MRRLFFVLVLVLAACGGNGDGMKATPEPVQHVPEISNLTLSPDSALYMEGGGVVQVTAELAFTDRGRDIATLRVEMSDGTSMSIPVPESVNTVSGTLAETFDVTTADATGCTVEIWLVDRAGQSSNQLSAQFDVIGHAPEISDLTLSPDSALYMEGDGSVPATVEFDFTDLGRDLETLMVWTSDGPSRAITVPESFGTESGTIVEAIDVSTAAAYGRTIKIWLVDRAGQSSNRLSARFDVIRHVPEITNLTLSADTASYMEGNGSVLATVEMTFRDAGSDLRALRVRMPDDKIIEFAESISSETGTFSEDLTVSTKTVGTVALEFLLVDQAGDNSDPVTAEFRVVADMHSGDWTNRLSGLPDKLWDVVWDGSVFIAVGNGGTIFTSADGITWVAIESGTGADLNAVAFYGSDIYAVGDEIILRSTDHGASWTVKDRPIEAVLRALAINSSQVVVGGNRFVGGTAITMISEDRGDTWRAVDSWPDESLHMNDLIYRDGLFVASTFSFEDLKGWVTVSSDGKLWSEIAVSDEWTVLHTIIHDGRQFILAGMEGTVFTSPDGFNWTGLQTPVRDVFYTSAAWSGSKLVLAGPWSCGYLGGRCDSAFDLPPVGLSTTDGGLSWEIMNIDGDYESRGLAWGNGRFVSVGGKPPYSNEGAIYTAE